VIITAANLASYLAELPANTADSPHTIPLAAGTNITSNWAAITSAVQSSGRYVVLDLSACTANGNTVTGVNNQYIKGVVLPSTLTSIMREAFRYCTNLTSVTLPASLTSIGGQAFEYCSSLTSVTIPDSVTSIGELAFSDCTSLTSVTIGNGVTFIDGAVFAAYTSLTSITIPAGVTSIGDGAFHVCDSLTSVTFAGSAAVLNEYNRSFPSNASLLSAGGATAGGAPMQAGTYTLSGGVWTKR
jgi:hypothetical protein